MDVTTSDEMAAEDGAQFNPGRHFMAAFFSLCILVVVNSLDATALGPAIPVRQSSHPDDSQLVRGAVVLTKL